MSLKYSIPASTTTSTTEAPVSCQNPIFEIFNGMFIKKDDATYVTDYVNSVFQRGLVSSNCHFCCPTCNSDVYFFGSEQEFIQLSEAYPPVEQCCVNSVTTEGSTINCPSTNFTSCLNTLKNIIGQTRYDELLIDGLFEAGTIAGGKTMICKLIEELQKSPAYSADLVYNFFSALQQTSILVYCDDQRVYISYIPSQI